MDPEEAMQMGDVHHPSGALIARRQTPVHRDLRLHRVDGMLSRPRGRRGSGKVIVASVTIYAVSTRCSPTPLAPESGHVAPGQHGDGDVPA